jgi:hypothetical protein
MFACMGQLYNYWKDKVGSSVVFKGKIKLLEEGTKGVLTSVNKNFGVITYPQNAAHEPNGKGGWSPIRGAPNQIYAHSVLLRDLNELP